MRATFSIFPKFFQQLSVDELAELVADCGLDTTNMIVRDGYWVTEENLATEAPAFIKAMTGHGLRVTFGSPCFVPGKILEDDGPVRILADNGITEFRMGYFQIEDGETPAAALDRARGEMEQIASICERIGIRAVYQVHHGMFISSASAAYAITRGLPPGTVGVMLDPGNQGFEGFEEWRVTVPLLGDGLAAVGIKDVRVVHDPAQADTPAKGWERQWAPIDEGITNWHDVCRALHRIEFDGTFVWMPFVESDPAANAAIVKREVDYLRRVVAETATA